MPELITQSEIENLSSDPVQRFVAIEEICRLRCDEITAKYDDDNNNWYIVEQARRSYMTALVAAAKHFDISPINRMEVPKKSNWDNDAYIDFKNEIEFYSMQLALQGAERNSQVSIVLQGSTKDRLLTLTSTMREQVRKLDLPASKIDRLIERLNKFETELSGKRLNFMAVAVVAMAVAEGIANLDGAASGIRHLMNEIEEAVGQAKEAQATDAVRALPQTEIKKLEPPRKEEPEQPPAKYASYDLDDEIPF